MSTPTTAMTRGLAAVTWRLHRILGHHRWTRSDQRLLDDETARYRNEQWLRKRYFNDGGSLRAVAAVVLTAAAVLVAVAGFVLGVTW